MSFLAESVVMPTAPSTARPPELRTPDLQRALLGGAFVCASYAILNLLVNGLVLDELIVPGQIIAKLVTYPTGHPHEVFSREAFSLLNYLAGALLFVLRDATVVSGLLNVCFLFFSTFAPFALALVLTQSATWGYAAAALSAAEAALRLDGLYPLFVFPAYFTNGHIGIYLAVLAIALVLGRLWRASGFVLGILPAVHVAMAMVVWPFAALYLALSARPRAEERTRLVKWFAAGFAVCVLLGVIVMLQARQTTMAAPYDGADGGAIYRSFSAHTDTHRRLFRPESFGYLVNPVAFFCLAALSVLRGRRKGKPGPGLHETRWLLGFGAAVWAYVYLAWLVKSAGVSLPTVLNILMPFRYANLSAIMLVPLTVSVLARTCDALSPSRRTVASAILGVLLIGGALLGLIQRELVQRNLLMVLWAAYFSFELYADDGNKRTRLSAVAAFALICMTLLPFIAVTRVVLYMAATFVLAGGALLLAGSRGRVLSVAPRLQYTVPALSLLLALSALPGRRGDAHPDRAYMRISQFDRELTTWLAAHEPNEMILPAISPWTALQTKTGHPVLFQWETLYLMTYMPRLAPTIGAMAFDLYGVNYGDEARLNSVCGGRMNQWCPEWLVAWQQRSPDQWQALAQKYGFRLVLAPSNIQLTLPLALQGPVWTLYRIP